MRFGFWTFAVATFGAGMLPLQQPPAPTAVLIGGDTHGYLSPCGCVKPMTGGIRRRVAALRALEIPGRTVVLDAGSLSGGLSRQNELKAETLAECLKLAGVDAIHLTLEDAKLGSAVVAATNRLSGGALVSTGLGIKGAEVQSFVVSGPLLVGGYDHRADALAASMAVPAATLQECLDSLRSESKALELTPALLLSDGLEAARHVAGRFPWLRLIIYSSQSAPPTELEMVGNVALATPGEKGKYVVRLLWDGRKFHSYQALPLGPEIEDDPDAQRLYAAYLARVESENLLDLVPRFKTEPFAGSRSCRSCHESEFQVWEKSKHAQAYDTLEREGHARDPDCVGCHVVGLNSVNGFKSRDTTRDLVHVGCESCHGPAKAHTMDPAKHQLGSAGTDSCMKCHVPEHSPGFRFDTHWPQIAH